MKGRKLVGSLESRTRKIHGLMIFSLLVILIFAGNGAERASAESIRLNKRKLVMEEGTIQNLKMRGTVKEVSWSVQNTEIALVDSNGMVSTKNAGETVITAKVNGKHYYCRLTVVPKFQVDEETIAEEMVDRKIKFAGQDITIHDEEEISEVKILSKITSKDGKQKTIKAELSIERDVADFTSEVLLYYKTVRNSWKVTKVRSTTEIDELKMEDIWIGEVDVYDYSRNEMENCKVIVDVDKVKSDGRFSCEATIEGLETDILSMYGEVDLETGAVTFYGLQWLMAESDNAKSLEEKGKVLNFYCLLDFEQDACISDDSIALKKTYVENLMLEKEECCDLERNPDKETVSDDSTNKNTVVDWKKDQEGSMIYEEY